MTSQHWLTEGTVFDTLTRTWSQRPEPVNSWRTSVEFLKNPREKSFRKAYPSPHETLMSLSELYQRAESL